MGYISEDYCSEELSGMLMEKGYIGATNTYLGKDDINVKQITLQSAMKWLREVHKLTIYPFLDNLLDIKSAWWYRIVRNTGLILIDEKEEDPIYGTYEEACEEAIRYCLEKLI